MTILLGCRPSPVDFAEQSFEAQSEDGHVRVPVSVTDETSLLVGVVGDALLAVTRIEAPDGAVLEADDWLGNERLTAAVYAVPGQTVVNWPVRAEDTPLSPGEWVVEVGMYDAALDSLDSLPVTGVVRTKTDDDVTRGTLFARVLVPNALDPALKDGLDGALNRWERIWKRAGLRLEVVVDERDLPVVVPDLVEGDPAIGALLDDEPADLVVWVGEALSAPDGALGFAGTTPNATVPGAGRGIVAVAAAVAAGTDGELSRPEIELLGETLAHEAGHYVGLFHPVENNLVLVDALSDTPTCSGTESCEAALGGNLMFPYPICEDGVCIAADSLTDQQRGVAHRYVGVR